MKLCGTLKLASAGREFKEGLFSKGGQNAGNPGWVDWYPEARDHLEAGRGKGMECLPGPRN